MTLGLGKLMGKMNPNTWAQREAEEALRRRGMEAAAERVAYAAEMQELERRAREDYERRKAEEWEKQVKLQQQQADLERRRGMMGGGTIGGTTGGTWATSPPGSLPQDVGDIEWIVEAYTDPSDPIGGPKYRKVPKVANKIQATVHKAGHFPIQWMIEANERAEASDKLIRIQLEKEGVAVIGTEAENYETHTLTWAMMDKAEVNPIILGIETVEKHLDTLHRLKKRVKAA